MKSRVLPLFAALTAASTLAACGSSTPAGGDDSYVSGGNYTAALQGDPGTLSPLSGISLEARAMVSYAYEDLVHVTKNGDFKPWLATSWTATGTQITYQLHSGITCSDGTPFTAETAANNINYNAQKSHATFYYGSQVDERLHASATGDTLTITSNENDPFLLANTGTIAMVCQAGLDHPDTLKTQTSGTGLYALTSAQSGSAYTYTKRKDYKWGPGDVTSDTVGLPDTVTVKVIPNESTAANLLLSGDINAATVKGDDQQRLSAANLATVTERNPIGEVLFNERTDRVTADPLVRKALMLALKRQDVASVVANGAAEPSVSLVVKNPLLCVAGGPKWTLPDQNLAEAGQLLDQAGWTLGADGKRAKNGKPLTVKFIYDAATPSHAPAAELVQQSWNKLGVTTTLSANDASAWSAQLYQTFDWDLGFVQIDPGSPAVAATFFNGATPDKSGNNFMFVDNPEYDALIKQAQSASPDTTCGLWQQAEAALVNRTDVYPITDSELATYFKGAKLTDTLFYSPTEIRMLG
ncbi:ABC transporter substrate-binding protein [Amycolatopsis sp. GM8]|uniref:ABC transporter substrate-binding protein n=1 Tax=Amycolatopsis sp. GM8 TaxID=2896530 RepID=UPI001F39BAB3|nr:ABC transporter substrate-binding protein [Amycolatopsis sp. GM8]